jgi:Transposase, Mutator family
VLSASRCRRGEHLRARVVRGKLPEREGERVRQAYWQALDDATDERDGKHRLQALVDELDAAGYTAAAKCLADDLDALVVHLRYPTRHRRRWRSTNLLERSGVLSAAASSLFRRFPLLGAGVGALVGGFGLLAELVVQVRELLAEARYPFV